MLFGEIYIPQGSFAAEQLREEAQQLSLARLVDYSIAAGETTPRRLLRQPGVATLPGDVSQVTVIS